jgi:RND family efflux transporter MFP subunit
MWSTASAVAKILVCSIALAFAQHVAAADVPAAGLKLSAEQFKAMDIALAPLSLRNGSNLGGLPAQIVIPAQQMHLVSAPLAGFVERIEVAAQQSVRRGQPLARLQSPQLAELRRAYLQAQTQAELAKRSLERDEKLLADGIIAESRALATRSQHTEAQALLVERRQALHLAGASGTASGSELRIASPIDGVVLEQLVQLGQRVEAAAPLFKVARLDPLWLEIQVPSAQAATLATGAVVSARSATMPEPVKGHVITIGRVVSPGSQSVLVRAQIGDAAGRLQPGQFIEASIALASGASLYAVPTAALFRNGGKVQVFVRTAEGFRVQPVTVSAEGPQESVVSGKFTGNEQIAVRGIAALKASLMGIGTE